MIFEIYENSKNVFGCFCVGLTQRVSSVNNQLITTTNNIVSH